MTKRNESEVRWEDLEYIDITHRTTLAWRDALTNAGVPIRSIVVEPERTEEIVETEVSWGGSHVEFETSPPAPPQCRTIPARYRYEAPLVLFLLDSWRDPADVAVWVAKTFSPGMLGTMYALHEGDWQDYIRELWREAKGKQR